MSAMKWDTVSDGLARYWKGKGANSRLAVDANGCYSKSSLPMMVTISVSN